MHKSNSELVVCKYCNSTNVVKFGTLGIGMSK